jgi:hypothetical protein
VPFEQCRLSQVGHPRTPPRTAQRKRLRRCSVPSPAGLTTSTRLLAPIPSTGSGYNAAAVASPLHRPTACTVVNVNSRVARLPPRSIASSHRVSWSWGANVELRLGGAARANPPPQLRPSTGRVGVISPLRSWRCVGTADGRPRGSLIPELGGFVDGSSTAGRGTPEPADFAVASPSTTSASAGRAPRDRCWRGG